LLVRFVNFSLPRGLSMHMSMPTAMAVCVAMALTSGSLGVDTERMGEPKSNITLDKPRKKTRRPKKRSMMAKPKRVVGAGPAVDAFAARQALTQYAEEFNARKEAIEAEATDASELFVNSGPMLKEATALLDVKHVAQVPPLIVTQIESCYNEQKVIHRLQITAATTQARECARQVINHFFASATWETEAFEAQVRLDTPFIWDSIEAHWLVQLCDKLANTAPTPRECAMEVMNAYLPKLDDTIWKRLFGKDKETFKQEFERDLDGVRNQMVEQPDIALVKQRHVTRTISRASY